MSKKIAIVTGANRGIGLETARQLCQQGFEVVLAARTIAKAQASCELLLKENCKAIPAELDVSNEASISKFRDFLKNKFTKIDLLINNAGIFLDGKTAKEISFFNVSEASLLATLRTNLFGPIFLCRELIPLMKGSGQVINISSGMGQLNGMNGGYPAYRISKTGLNVVTKILADELSDTEIKINSICPGWVKTDMGGSEAERTVAKGAETIIWLATLKNNIPSGKFFRDMQPIEF